MFVNNVSLGVYAEVVQSDEYRDDKVGTALRKLPDLVGPDAEPFDLHFTAPDGDDHATAHLLMVSNNPYGSIAWSGWGRGRASTRACSASCRWRSTGPGRRPSSSR